MGSPDDASCDENALAAAVDEAIGPEMRRSWAAHVASERVLIARQAIFADQGRTFAHQLSFRATGFTSEDASTWTPQHHERATEHVLRATFGRLDLEDVARGLPLFVRCPRAYLVQDLPVPYRPDRLVIELGRDPVADDRLLEGVRRLRAQGFRIAMPGFVGSPEQRNLLPLVDFVKIDVRDLDVEGAPVVERARATGARLIAEYVEGVQALAHARDLGFGLFQGHLLRRPDVLDRTSAPPARDPVA